MVTGGAGFIGTNFIRFLFSEAGPKSRVINVDALTYAGNLENLKDIAKQYSGSRYFFENEDICNQNQIKTIAQKYEIDTVVHFAAESHVDRSILGPADFIQSNIIGTFNLLETFREIWHGRDDVLFHHVSTDEVYGSLGSTGYFSESSSYDPNSPYAASKASSDHLVRAYYRTYGLPITISNCTNNYGPYQFPEKLIPLMILNILEEKQLPVYGDGKNTRDWLFVDDHCRAIWSILVSGGAGDTYLVGGENEWENIKLIQTLCEKIAEVTGKKSDFYERLIAHVKDRPGHDRRYAVDPSKIKSELNWNPTVGFSEGLDRTITWYTENLDWVDRVRSGEYRQWIEKNYQLRENGVG